MSIEDAEWLCLESDKTGEQRVTESRIAEIRPRIARRDSRSAREPRDLHFLAEKRVVVRDW